MMRWTPDTERELREGIPLGSGGHRLEGDFPIPMSLPNFCKCSEELVRQQIMASGYALMSAVEVRRIFGLSDAGDENAVMPEESR